MLRKCISLILILAMIVSILTIIPLSVSAEKSSDTTAELANNDLTVTGTNSLGSMLAAEYEENEEDSEDTGCGIYAVEVEGKTARVDVRTLTDAQLVVSIYDEDGKTMYGSGMADVTKDDSIVELTLEINTMPQYFYIKAFLLDKYTNLPLCKQFENNYYTQEMQEFFAKTTDDFDEEKVLNLDNSEEENFLVYNDDTIIIENVDENTNVVTKADDDSKEYVIENINDQISVLQTGDIFSYDFGDGNLLIIKINSITINGTIATIKGDEIDLKEAFDYIKIDTLSYIDEAGYDPSNISEGVEYLGAENSEEDIASTGADANDTAETGIALIDWSAEHSHELRFKFGDKKKADENYDSETTSSNDPKTKMYGEFGVKIGVKFRCFYDERWLFGRTIEISTELKYELSVSLKAKFEIKEPFPIKLGYLPFEPFPGVTISVTPSVLISGKLKATFGLTFKGQFGFRYKDGYGEDLGKSPQLDFEVDFEGELFVGLSLEPEISVLGDIAKAKVEAIGGLRITGKTHHSTADGFDNQPSEKHTCTVCIEGEISLVLKLNLELSLFNNPDLTYRANFGKAEWTLTDFYWSLDHAEFGFGTCPYRQYKCSITLVDPDKKPLSDVTVNEEKTDSNGKAVMYLQRGANKLTIKKGDKAVIRTLYVKGAEKPTIIIDFDKPQSIGNGNNVTSIKRYKLWVNGEQISDNHLTIQCGIGTATYNPYTSTLTLDNAIITRGVTFDSLYTGILTHLDKELTIIVKGDCYIIETDGDGIGSYGDLDKDWHSLPHDITVKGDGKLTITESTRLYGYGIYCTGALTLDGVDITICSAASGVWAKSLTVKNSNIDIECSTNFSGFFVDNGDFLYENSTVTAESAEGAGVFLGNDLFPSHFTLNSGEMNLKGTVGIGADTDASTVTINGGKLVIETSNAAFNEKFTVDADAHIFLGKDVSVTSGRLDGTLVVIEKASKKLTNNQLSFTGTGIENSISELVNEKNGYKRQHFVPNTEAILVALKGTEESAVFDAFSLLYITQEMVDENGEISFDAPEDFGDESWVAYIFGECDHSASTWKTSKKPTVEEEGLKVLICDHCGAVLDSEAIEALSAAYILGDADGNGEIESVDATFIQRCIAQIPTPYTKAELMRGDVDSSGDLELTDVTAIQYYLCHLKTPYPIGESVS